MVTVEGGKVGTITITTESGRTSSERTDIESPVILLTSTVDFMTSEMTDIYPPLSLVATFEGGRVGVVVATVESGLA